MSTDSAFRTRIALAGLLSLLVGFASAESWARPKKSRPPKAKSCQRTEDCNERDGCRYCNKRTRRCDWLPNCCHPKRPCKKGSCMGVWYGYCQSGPTPKNDCGSKPCPPWPTCSRDDHCRSAGGFCLNGRCGSCRSNGQCQLIHPCRVCDPNTRYCEMRLGCCLTLSDCYSHGSNYFRCVRTPGERVGQCLIGCNSDAVCGPYERCRNGACVDRCRPGQACSLGSYCSDGACVLGCRSTHDCPKGKFCYDQECKPGCDSDSRCAKNQVCRTNKCVPRSK